MPRRSRGSPPLNGDTSFTVWLSSDVRVGRDLGSVLRELVENDQVVARKLARIELERDVSRTGERG